MPELSWRETREFVYERAEGCCEYCRTCEANTGQTMQIDHIDPDGGDAIENLCLACWNCNNHKRKITEILHPATDTMTPLFNPRTQRWTDHFEWIDNGQVIRGLTPIGDVTISRLKMNRLQLVVARQRWIEGGYHPPQ